MIIVVWLIVGLCVWAYDETDDWSGVAWMLAVLVVIAAALWGLAGNHGR